MGTWKQHQSEWERHGYRNGLNTGTAVGGIAGAILGLVIAAREYDRKRKAEQEVERVWGNTPSTPKLPSCLRSKHSKFPWE